MLDGTLNQAEKFNQVLEIGAGYFGIAEEKARTSAGSWAQLKNTWGDSLEIIGTGMLPALTKVSLALNSMIRSVGGVSGAFEAEKKAIIGQRVEFERLVMIYKELHFNQNRTKEQNTLYAKTINDLMTKYPNYLKGINLEKDAWGEIATALSRAGLQLQNYINKQIQEAVVKDMEQQIVDLSKQVVNKQSQLYTLKAEFAAGTKSPVRMAQTAPNPLSSGANMPGSTQVISKWGMQEVQLEADISKLQKREEQLNGVLKQRIEIAQKIYALPPFDEVKGSGGGGSGQEGSKNQESDKKRLLEDIATFKRAKDAGFNEREVAFKELEAEYDANLKLVKGNRVAEAELFMKYEQDKLNLKAEYKKADEDATKQYYESVKFYDKDYYAWKREQIELEAKIMFPKDEPIRRAWEADNVQNLDKEKAAFDNKVVLEFEGQYEADMSHLAELRELGLATYQEVADKAWEYYETLKKIVEVDGNVSQAEIEKLEMLKGRAQKAQLAVNRETDLASYYNQVKFLDAGYYEWKKSRIEEDVRVMQVSEEQKAVILKQRINELKSERNSGGGEIDFRGKMLGAIGIEPSDRDAIVSQYQQIAGQISAIWGQLYSNLESSRNNAIKKLEDRAKAERRSEAWLSAEKEKINAEYEKKVRAMRRIEQKVQIASAMMNTAEGVTNALTLKPAWYAVPAAIAIGALGAVQVGMIASQKFAQGGSPGLFRGKGTSTSDSNVIAISDEEYIISAERVRKFGLPFFDAINFGDAENVRKALGNIKMGGVSYVAPQVVNNHYSNGGEVRSTSLQNKELHVVLKCDSRVLARAVARGNKQLLILD